MTHPGDVERYHFTLRHPARDRREQLDVAADAVEQKQRHTAAISCLPSDAQFLTVEPQHLGGEGMLVVRSGHLRETFGGGYHLGYCRKSVARLISFWVNVATSLERGAHRC